MRPIDSDNAASLVARAEPGLGRIIGLRGAPDGGWLLLTTEAVFRVDARSAAAPARFVARADDVAFHATVAAIAGGDVRVHDGRTERTLDACAGFSACAVAWSPGGDAVVAGFAEEGSDPFGAGRLRVLDAGGDLRWEEQVADGWVMAVAWRSDRIAFGTSTGRVRMRTPGGEPIGELGLDGLSPVPLALRFEDGGLLVLTVDDDVEMRVVRWAGGEAELLFRETVVAHAATALGPAGRIAFAPGDGEGQSARLQIGSVGGGPMKRGGKLAGEVSAIAFSSDGAEVAVADAEGLRVLDSAAGKRRASRSLDEKPSVEAIAIAPDSSLVASIGREPGVVLWSAGDARIVRRVALPERAWSMRWLPDGRIVTAASGRLFFIDAGGAVASEPMPDARVLGLLSDRRTLAVRSAIGRESILVLLDTATGARRELRGGKGAVCGASLSYEGVFLLMATGGGKTLVRAFDDGTVLREIDVDLRATTSPCFSPAGSYLAWCEPGDYGTYRVRIGRDFDDDGRPVEGPRGAGRLLFSPDGGRLLVGGGPGWIVDPEAAVSIAEVAIGASAAWSPDGALVAGVGAYAALDFTLYSRDGARLATYRPGAPIAELAFSPDGRFLVAATLTGGIVVYQPS